MTVQNLVVIDAVISIVCNFNILHVKFENAYSRAHNRSFWKFYPQNLEQYERDPKRHIVGRKHVVRRVGRQNWSTCADSARAEV